MAKEIERKFLVEGDGFRRSVASSSEIMQGYLSVNPDATVRVRIADGRAWLTVKSRSVGAERGEWEYEIPVDDARAMVQACGLPMLSKVRHRVPAGRGLCWEVDEFVNPCAGLVVAEIELPRADAEFERPDWLGREVTGNPEYYNSSIMAKIEKNRN